MMQSIPAEAPGSTLLAPPAEKHPRELAEREPADLVDNDGDYRSEARVPRFLGRSGIGLVGAASIVAATVSFWIGVQHLANGVPETHDLIENNLVRGNREDGIVVGRAGLSAALQNPIQNNTSTGNARGPTFPAAFDLTDFSPDCATNVWLNNRWGSGGFNPACTTTGGSPAPMMAAAPSPVVPLRMVLCGRGLWCPAVQPSVRPFGHG